MTPSKLVAVLGWTVLFLGAAMLLFHYFQYGWDWLMLGVGAAFLLLAWRSRDAGTVLPGLTLFIGAGAVVLKQAGLWDFPEWRIWPMLMGAAGLGFLTLWSLDRARAWALPIAGLLFLCCGSGFGFSSFWTWQRWLRSVVDFWPLLLVFYGVYLLLLHRLRSGIRPEIHSRTSE